MFEELEMKDDEDKKETITLYNLKFEYEDQYYGKKEHDLENKEENLSKNQYYKIEDKKLGELEKVFKQIKTKIKLDFNFARFFKSETIFDIKKKKTKFFALFMIEKISLKE
jgi:hypothetical protein